jgi:hypothetical protein
VHCDGAYHEIGEQTHRKMALDGTKLVQSQKKSARIRRFIVKKRDFG